MSSAILFVAIVAIWAGVLVPRWLRLRSAPLSRPLRAPSQDHAAEPSQDHAAEPSQDHAAEPSPDHAAEPSPGQAPVGQATLRQAWTPLGQAGAQRGQAPSGEAPRERTPLEPPAVVRASAERAGSVPASADQAGSAHAPANPAPGEPHTSAVRAQTLSARRWMLATLVMLAVAAAGAAVVHLAPTWVAIPPLLMLAGFLVLLRGAAHIDAERDRRRTLAAHPQPQSVASQPEPASAQPEPVPGRRAAVPGRRAAAGGLAAAAGGRELAADERTPGPDGARPPAAVPGTPAAGTVPTPRTGEFLEVSAQVIDISGRVKDQFYDQYADAAERAVGD